jgi:CRP-like cAMP-binding protein
MCILERLPRSATVEATTETHLLLLSYAAFEILFERMPLDHDCVISNMARALSARLRELGDFLALRG